MKNKNYKYFVGLIIGLILVTVVYGTSSILSSDVVYDNTNSSYSTGNVQGAIDDLSSKIENPTSCLDGYYCEKIKTTLELGDYVSYTPIVTSYSTDTTKTGYSSSQTIYPSELNLWRVLNINDDETVDLISEYVSSTNVYFQGQTGYQNFVGYLNVLASQYETEGVTKGSRHFGYNGQTEYITDTSKLSLEEPWTSSTVDNSNESLGGGDILYEKDYNQVNLVLGTALAFQAGTSTYNTYWITSRHYGYTNFFGRKYVAWQGRFLSKNSSAESAVFFGKAFADINSKGHALRPIVTLKSGLEYQGVGTEYYPMEIVS